MGDYDATQVWDYEMSSHDYLDESYTCKQEDTWDLDDDYGRDSTDWQQMAYIHFAWELVRISHYTIVRHTFGKIVGQYLNWNKFLYFIIFLNKIRYWEPQP